MASSKRAYMAKFVEDAMQNPRKCFGGHGIPAGIINEASERADVFAKLAGLSWNSKNRTKYSAGLKACKEFKMVGYKNFANFNVKVRSDIEDFINGLSEADQETFKNNQNIVVIVMQNDNEVCADNDEQIKTGPSLIISFDRAIRADQKSINGSYIVVMFADSWINKSEASKEPAVVVDQSTSAQAQTIAKKKVLKKKSLNSRLKDINAKRNQLQNRRQMLGRQIEGMNAQRLQMQSIFGEDIEAGIALMDKTNKSWNKDFMSLSKKATKNDKTLLKAIGELKAKNAKPSLIRTLLKNFDDQTLATMIETGEPMSGSIKLASRRKELKKQLRKLRQEADICLVEISRAKSAGDKKSVLNAQNALRRISKNIDNLRGRLGSYKNMSPDAVNRKTEMLNSVTADIEKLILKGNTITQAMNKALEKSLATEGEKEAIKQQVIKQIADGSNPVLSVQQAIQENVSNQRGLSVSEMLQKGLL